MVIDGDGLGDPSGGHYDRRGGQGRRQRASRRTVALGAKGELAYDGLRSNLGGGTASWGHGESRGGEREEGDALVRSESTG